MKIIDRSDAFRIGQLTERRSRIHTQQQLLQLQIDACNLEIRKIMAIYGLAAPMASHVVVDPGELHEVGTVLDTNGKPMDTHSQTVSSVLGNS